MIITAIVLLLVAIVLLVIDINVRIKQMKINNNALDVNYPVKVLNPTGRVYYCKSVGKEKVIVSQYQNTDVYTETIDIFDFKNRWTMPKHLEQVVNKTISQKEASEYLESALMELK